MRAAILHGPGDLRVEEVAEPAPGPGELLVRVDAATTCGTDVKMWQRGHPILAPYPARFGHETAGTCADTGERVLVGDSLACGECGPCRARRPQICRGVRWILGGFAEAIAAPEEALHRVPEGLEPAGAAMAEPLAAALHAIGRAPARALASGSCVVFVGGCAAGTDARLPTRPLHYDELDLRGAFHHAPEEIDRALALLADGAIDWRALAAGPIGLDELAGALASGNDGPARKWVVESG